MVNVASRPQESLDAAPLRLNRFIRSAYKTEGDSYAEAVAVLGRMRASVDDKAAKELFWQLLSRLLQYGGVTVSSMQFLLDALQADVPGMEKEDRMVTRTLYYLVQLALGDGYAGTPLPQPAGKGAVLLPKAVDRLGPEVLSAAWADLGNERSAFMRKQGALRALAALAHASLTSRPEDPTYPAGLLVTLQSLLDRIDSLRESKRSLAAIIAQHGKAGSSKKSMVSEFKSNMEMSGLMRLAYSAARVALSKSGIAKVAVRCFPGLTSSDIVCARHAMALAAVVARDPHACKAFIDEASPLLKNNVELAKQTGLLYTNGGRKVELDAAAPPTVLRAQPASYLNLRDPWSRIYLARACASVIQSGYIAGDIHGAGSVFWDALVLLAINDDNEMVAMEAIKVMFGAPYPKAESARRRHLAAGDVDADLAQSRLCAASWQMIMSVASVDLAYPAVSLLAPTSGDGGSPSDTSLMGRVVNRLQLALQAHSPALSSSAAKSTGAILEARAWSTSFSPGPVAEAEWVQKAVRSLQASLAAVLSRSTSASVQCAAVESLLWACGPGDRPVLAPSQLLRVISQGGASVAPVVRALFADPWPEALVISFLQSALRRLKSGNASMADYILDLVLAACAGAPSRVSRDLLQQVFSAAPGPCTLRAAIEMCSAPAPPITQSAVTAAVEVKAFAAQEEAAFEGLRCFATWWLGENVNQVCGDASSRKSMVYMEGKPGHVSEAITTTAAEGSPALEMAVVHMQRMAITGPWETKVAALQALTKIALRSPEPFRIQAYTVLTAVCSAAAGCMDMFGLSPIVQPLVEALDLVFSGSLVLVQQPSYVSNESSWTAAQVQSVKRRHDWLVLFLQQRIGFVQKDGFFPLGPRSKRILKPDEEQGANMSDDDIPTLPEFLHQTHPGSDVLDDDVSSIAEADPLAQWHDDGHGIPHMELKWQGLGDGVGVSHADSDDEEDVRWATVMFDFKAESEDEVSVAKGERIRIYVDMGEWLHVLTTAGTQGLIPASYTNTDDAASIASSFSQRYSTAGAGAGHGATEETTDQYGASEFGYSGGAYFAGANDTGPENVAQGGFDDFGAALAAASQMRAQAQAAAQARATQQSFSAKSTSSVESNSSELPVMSTSTQQHPFIGASDFVAQFAAMGEQTLDKTPLSAVEPGTTSTTIHVDESTIPESGHDNEEQEERPGVALYSFQAELENELSIEPGDSLVVKAEVDGWYHVIRPDGQAGLVPASYVQIV